VDTRISLPDGSVIRERRKAPTASKSAAQRWAESRERVLLVNGKPDRTKKEVLRTTTLREFAPRFIEGHAKANRLKASGVASKECVLRLHLVPALGDKPLAAITTEDVQQLKSALGARSPKTVNNVLTVLNVLMRTAVEWNVIERVQCSIKMPRTPKGEAGFYEFDQFERLVEASARESQAELVVLLGGEAGLRCGEMIGLEWSRGHPAVGRAGGNSWRNRGGVGNEGLSPPFLFEEIGGGAGSCTRVRKYIPAGIYDAYPPLICRPRREEAARTAGGQPRNISLPPSRTTGVSQPAELTSVPHPQADEDGRSQGFRLRVRAAYPQLGWFHLLTRVMVLGTHPTEPYLRRSWVAPFVDVQLYEPRTHASNDCATLT